MEQLFQEIGLSETKAKETAKNAKVSKNLAAVIEEAKKLVPQVNGNQGTLLYHIASKMKPQVFHHAPLLVGYVIRNEVDSEPRLNAALEFLLKHPEPTVDKKSFEDSCGVGIVVTPEEVEKEVETVIKKVKNEILAKRYRYPAGMLQGQVRKTLPWADAKMVKNEIDMQILDLLGPKTEEDLAPPPKPEKKAKEPKGDKSVKGGNDTKKTKAPEDAEEEGAATIAELMRTKVNFHKPGENYTTDGYVMMPKTKEILAAHMKRTGGQVRTRFPPEPNGILHIGHAKAININFGYAKAHNGTTNLRYDDTNPEKEEEKFFVGIKDMVEWLGYTPTKITHSSDNFQQLYEWAKVIILDKIQNTYFFH